MIRASPSHSPQLHTCLTLPSPGSLLLPLRCLQVLLVLRRDAQPPSGGRHLRWAGLLELQRAGAEDQRREKTEWVLSPEVRPPHEVDGSTTYQEPRGGWIQWFQPLGQEL